MLIFNSCKREGKKSEPSLIEEISKLDLNKIPNINGIDSNMIMKYSKNSIAPIDNFVDIQDVNHNNGRNKREIDAISFFAYLYLD